MCEEQMKGKYREDDEGMGDDSFHDALVCRIPYGAAVCYLSESQHHATEGVQMMQTHPHCIDTYYH